MNTIKWIEEWYLSQCNDEWEHFFGIKINTLDNPGWFVQIDIANTGLANKSFEQIEEKNSDLDWMLCRVRENVFEGFGDPLKLEQLLNEFKKWVQS